MQVKISFTVDLDEVPRKVDEALVEAIKNLEFITNGRMIPINKENVVHSMEWIDKARKQLMRVDTRLMECYSMLAGYNKAIADSLMPQTEPEQAQEAPAEEGGDVQS